MNLDKVLFATDFSPGSEAAFPYACSLAAAEGATMLIVHVDDTTPGLVFGDVGYGYVPQVDEIARQEYEQLKAITPSSTKIVYEYRFLRGDAADGILKVARREQVDLVVLGTHGKTGLGRLLMGSVAESVVRRAKCPVLTVKQPIPDSEVLASSEQRASKV